MGLMRISRILLSLVVLSLFLAGACQAGKGGDDVRPPAFAGKFYPESATVLKEAVEKFLVDALPARAGEPLAIVVPHAGYIYSGQIRADGYNQVRKGDYETVVILGTNHTSPGLRKVALYPGAGFRTPLGTAAVDTKTVEALVAASRDCTPDAAPHSREHSVEVQVPFIQLLFPKAKIVPAVVGEADGALYARFGAALAHLLKGRRALVVASSDLSHYPSAADARLVDLKTLALIPSLDPAAFAAATGIQAGRRIPNLSTCACGAAPIMAAMAAARAMGATAGRVVSYANSGDLPMGERDRVVGYGAVVLGSYPEPAGVSSVAPPPAASAADPAGGQALSEKDKKALLALARETIARFLTVQTVPLVRGFSPAAMAERGVFVTLRKKGELRGCIGRMTPDRPLALLVGAMALRAAFDDPRFGPVSLPEVAGLEIEISVLTPMQAVPGPDAIVVGRDGVLLTVGERSAVFLPQVAPEQGWNRNEMLDHLSRKAGLPASAWRGAGASFQTFQALVFSEAEIK